MKKTMTIMLLVVLAFSLSGPSAFAATASSPAYTASASVDGTLSLTVALKKNSSTGATLGSLDFGQLVPFVQASGTTLRSSTTGSTGTGSVYAMITANSHGLPYTITQTGTALGTLPTGACTVVPNYAAADNGGLAKPAAATVGAAGSWIGTRTIYTSETGTAAMRTVQAIYSITDDPAAGATAAVPINQAGGTYSGGTVQITVTA